MRRLAVFNQVTLDGYFTDRNGDMSWAHKNAGHGRADEQRAEVVFSRTMDKASWKNTKLVKSGMVGTLFEGINEKLMLKRTNTRAFGNGNVVLSYQPMA
jgi:hypothetical protein